MFLHFPFPFFNLIWVRSFFTQIHPAMLHTATSLRLYTSPYFNANYTIIPLLSMAHILSCRLHLYAFTSSCMYASTLVRLYASLPRRLYASMPLLLYGFMPLRIKASTPVRLWYFTLPSLIGEAITSTRDRRNRA